MTSFADMALPEALLSALQDKNITSPTPIQELVIPRLLSGSGPLIGQARTGTGKTAAFGLPILCQTREAAGKVSALVLVPTRELAMQIAGEIGELAAYTRHRILPVYGGQAIEIQLKLLKKTPDIVVGTPGRVLDLLRRGALTLADAEFLILDEADEMLDMGFIDEIRAVLEQTSGREKMLMFSATMPPEIEKVAADFMPDYELCKVDTELSASSKLVRHIACEVKREDKCEALLRFARLEKDFYAIVFCRTRSDVDELTEKLHAKKYPAESLHGEISQAQRTRVINGFKHKRFPMLIATDVAARGIDVSDLDYVVNYSLPQTLESFIHRTGRTGRAGKSGCAITFYTSREKRKCSDFFAAAGLEPEYRDVPCGQELVANAAERIKETLAQQLLAAPDKGCRLLADELLKLFSPADLTAALLSELYGDSLDPEKYPALGKNRREKEEMVVLTYRRGKEDGVSAQELLSEIAQKSPSGLRKLGKIVCYEHKTRISCPVGCVNALLKAFNTGKEKLLFLPDETPKARGEKTPAKKPEKAGKPAAKRSEKRLNPVQDLRSTLRDVPLKFNASKKGKRS